MIIRTIPVRNNSKYFTVTHLQLSVLMFVSKLTIKQIHKMKTISVNTIKEQALDLNNKALKITEKRVLSSFDKVEKVQNKTDKLLKQGFEFSNKQQDIFFNNLENGKKMIWKNLNKTLDFFSKN